MIHPVDYCKRFYKYVHWIIYIHKIIKKIKTPILKIEICYKKAQISTLLNVLIYMVLLLTLPQTFLFSQLFYLLVITS